MVKSRNRIATVLAATAVAVGVSFGAGAGAATAAPRLTYTWSSYDNGESVVLYLYADGDYAGYVNWNADPDSFGTPGDALRAHDDTADGWGIEGRVLSAQVYRTASTRGHSSPYTTPWQTGDITEGHRMLLDACLVKGSEEVCTGYDTYVYA
ncbi:hypothetical protein ACIP98_19790 [Streptomyces sp. NPDC088354]|uniref:hypothetical protein n=1 Tax=unclassified Streptomyces TaxID=2593676 RepID=UPI0029BD45F0|nr:hypothetical protein [Streptomyces sp. MI02-7b]MDX3073260.1 hypothetical protein [Streptomyces sp. MI02-7b]